MPDTLFTLLNNFLALFIESAPWLLLGLFIAGVMNAWVPISLLQKHMGERDMGAISKAALIGAPLPLCSCGVIPAAVGLRRAGASKPATVSFLVSTPETGVDSISVSYALLGPLYAIVRPIAAIFSAIYTALIVRFLTRSEPQVSEHPQAPATGCCSAKKAAPVSCCDTPATPSRFSSVKQMMTFAFGKLLNDIVMWLMVGLLLAAAIQTWVPTDYLTQWGSGFMAMFIMAVVGIPMYICATASTPVALGFLAAGLSPGAVLVFMLAGPATNISTMGMIGKEMGKATLAGYLFGVISSSILLGYGFNLLLEYTGISIAFTQVDQHQHTMHSPVFIISALILAGLIARNLINKALHSATAHNTSSCH